MERMKVEDMVKALKCVEEQLEKQIPKEPKYKKQLRDFFWSGNRSQRRLSTLW